MKKIVKLLLVCTISSALSMENSYEHSTFDPCWPSTVPPWYLAEYRYEELFNAILEKDMKVVENGLFVHNNFYSFKEVAEKLNEFEELSSSTRKINISQIPLYQQIKGFFYTYEDVPPTLSLFRKLPAKVKKSVLEYQNREQLPGWPPYEEAQEALIVVSAIKKKFFKQVKNNRAAQWGKIARTFRENREHYKNALTSGNAQALRVALSKPMQLEEILEIFKKDS